MLELVTIPTAVFEYTVEYERPIIALWMERAKIIQAVFDSLSPWGVRVENLEGRNEGKAVDQGFAIKLPEKRATIFFGTAKFTFSLDGADWQQAQDTIPLLDASRTALLESSQSVIKIQRTAIAMHLQPKTVGFRDILMPFLPDTLVGLHHETVRTGAVILKWEHFGMTLDGSGSLANGIFLRLDRDFAPIVSFEEIAMTLRRDELAAFAALGIEEERT